ncbi:histidine kinase dimerization/phospho-acceptor domain-containing protein [Longispora sp. K20-0274]|uniref:sensor histidine kinase n=1 Tax=Longispora sp. K20-0274 TaxID=3088255 RepID=UPI00399BA497
MGDLLGVMALALGCSLAVALPGAFVLSRLRRRAIALHVGALVGVAVAAVAVGIVGAALAMFISTHDLTVLLVVVATSGLVSVGVALWLGRRFASDAMWAAEAESTRRELVAWVSHDLRTPLAGLRAMAEALEDGVVDDPETVAEYHKRIRVETDRMTGLVDDLFELSRINAGALRLTLASVALGDVVSDALAGAAPIAGARHVRLVAADGDWPAVLGSEPELSRVVGNLLINGIRHTPADGSVTVTGGRDAEGAWLAVTDGCGGIPADDLPRVFDVAFRGEPARSPAAAVPGLGNSAGLGLAIVRGLVEAQHGRVAVENVHGGCRFEVRLAAS